MATLISWMLILATTTTVLMVVATSREKWVRTAKERRIKAAEEEFRPVLVELLAQDQPRLEMVSFAGGTNEETARVIDELATGLMSKLRGEDRQTLRRLLDDRGVFDAARRNTRSSRVDERIRAVETLGSADEQFAAPEMVRLLTDASFDVRKAAARALGKLGNPEAIPDLMRTLRDESVPTSVVGMAVLHIGGAGIDELLKSLTSQSPQERLVAADCLGLMGSIAAVPVLMGLLDNEESVVVASTMIRALGRIGSPVASDCLCERLVAGSDAKVRAAAASALGFIGSNEAIEPLAEASLDEDHFVVRAATEALSRIGRVGVARLVELAQMDGAPGAFAIEALDGRNVAPNEVGSAA